MAKRKTIFGPWKLIPTYKSGGNTVQFYRVSDVPGFTHRVIFNGVAVGWLAHDHKPNRKAAQFFAEKHRAKLAFITDV